MNGQQKADDLSIINGDVVEILGTPPRWIIRWGSFLIFTLIVIFVFLSTFVRYPETIDGRVTVQPNFNVYQIRSSVGMEMIRIYVHDGDSIRKNNLLFVKKQSGRIDSMFAPANGIVIIQKKMTINEIASDSAVMLSILPFKRSYTASIDLPITGAGAIQIGQPINVSLASFPPSDFGQLMATVASRPSFDKNMATVNISLDNGTNTTYKKELMLYSPVEGIAEITVSNKKLYKRVFSFLK